MKDVMISITGIHEMPDDIEYSAEPVELLTGGKYCHTDEETVFSYMESELTGMEGTKTTFRITDKMVTLLREGSVSSQMVFQPGRKHVFLYDTEFGSVTMGVSTGRLVSGLTGSGGDLEIDYTLDMDSAVISSNSFKINIREMPGAGGTELSQ